MLDDNISILDLVILSKLESSKSEIRRLIKGNGVKINNQTISDEKSTFSSCVIRFSISPTSSNSRN